MENKQEAITETTAVDRFEKIIQTEIARDRRRFSENDSYDRDFRVLKETLRSDDFNRSEYGNDDLRDIADYLANSDKYSETFKDWLRTRKGEWELKTLPRNAGRIYGLSKRRLQNK